jgi:hypothetical protein
MGAAEVPPVATNGLGTMSTIMTDLGLVFRVTVNGLTGPMTAAHFHDAPLGANGPVVRTLTGYFIGGTADGVWMPGDGEPLTSTLVGEYFVGNIYTNVHTGAFPAGEIRGQSLELTPAAVEKPVPAASDLDLACRPNPLVDQTIVRFQLPDRGEVNLRVFDLSGREIRNLLRDTRGPGEQSLVFNSERLPSGVYLLRLESGGLAATQKLLVVH